MIQMCASRCRKGARSWQKRHAAHARSHLIFFFSIKALISSRSRSHGATHTSDYVQKPISFPRHRSRTRTQTHNEKAGAVGAFLPRLNQRLGSVPTPTRGGRHVPRAPALDLPLHLHAAEAQTTPLLARSTSPSQPPVKSILHSQDTLAFSAHKPPHPQIARKPRFSFLIDPSIHPSHPLREHARALVATRS
jgi:hypothetical protein